eukprot:2938388-Amphidinium_carterae.2
MPSVDSFDTLMASFFATRFCDHDCEEVDAPQHCAYHCLGSREVTGLMLIGRQLFATAMRASPKACGSSLPSCGVTWRTP